MSVQLLLQCIQFGHKDLLLGLLQTVRSHQLFRDQEILEESPYIDQCRKLHLNSK